MAYVPTRTTYKLVFDDEFAGLEVNARAGAVGDYMLIARLADVDWSPPYTAAQLEEVDELFRTFAGDSRNRKKYPGFIESWNIEEPVGKPLPITLEALKSLPVRLVQAIVVGWMDAIAGQALPLDRDGDLEASLPMDVAS